MMVFMLGKTMKHKTRSNSGLKSIKTALILLVVLVVVLAALVSMFEIYSKSPPPRREDLHPHVISQLEFIPGGIRIVINTEDIIEKNQCYVLVKNPDSRIDARLSELSHNDILFVDKDGDNKISMNDYFEIRGELAKNMTSVDIGMSFVGHPVVEVFLLWKKNDGTWTCREKGYTTIKGPDMVISEVVRMDASSVRTYKFKAYIENIGDRTAYGEIRTQFKVDEIPQDIKTIDTLQPNEIKTLVFEWTAQDLQTHDFLFIVDYDNQFLEYDKTNNEYQTSASPRS